MASCIKTCSCGRSFVAPAVAPKATRCRSCHKKEQQKKARMADARRRDREAREKAATLKGALIELFKLGHLPPSAVARQSGQQVVIAWQGQSFTYCLPKAA